MMFNNALRLFAGYIFLTLLFATWSGSYGILGIKVDSDNTGLLFKLSTSIAYLLLFLSVVGKFLRA